MYFLLLFADLDATHPFDHSSSILVQKSFFNLLTDSDLPVIKPSGNLLHVEVFRRLWGLVVFFFAAEVSSRRESLWKTEDCSSMEHEF